jgi:hypothetical protein
MALYSFWTFDGTFTLGSILLTLVSSLVFLAIGWFLSAAQSRSAAQHFYEEQTDERISETLFYGPSSS